MSSVSTSGPGRGDAAGPSGSRTPSPLGPLRGRLGELVFAGVAIALGVFALIGSLGIRVPESNRVGPTVFPVMVAVILLVASVAVMIGVLRGRLGSPEESEDVDLSHGTDWIAILKLVVLVVAHLLLIGLVGWWLAAAVLFGGAAWSLGAKRWWVALLVGLGLGLAIQILFGELLGLSLPLGPVLGWLGPLI
jgi:putative tricarboxylic transport membrane protein